MDATITRKAYPSDLTEEQWTIVAALLPAPPCGGRHRKTSMREVLNAVLYLLSSGCAWSQLPHDFLPEGTVRDYFHQWRRQGIWETIHNALRGKVRKQAGRNEQPSAAIIDSQSVKSTRTAGTRGYDAGKKNQRYQATHRGRYAGIIAGRRGSCGESARS